MKKALSVIFALAIILTMLPVNAFAKSDKVEIYGNKISVHAKQVCFVMGSKDVNSQLGSYYDSGFKNYYYYVGDETVDFKLVAEKLPELQNLVVVRSDVKNLSALAELKDLVWLGIHQCDGSQELSFLKKLTGLTKFRYTSVYGEKECENIKPVSYLKNLTELYLDVPAKATADISPIKGLTKLKKLDLQYVGNGCADIFKKLTNLRKLSFRFSSAKGDMSFLPYLKKLEYLKVSGDTDGFGTAAELKALKELRIDANDSDLSFIGEMKQLESLHISYCGSSFAKTAGRLKNLKELSLNTVNNGNPYDTSFISEMTNLESLAFSSNYSYNLDISGISKLKKLKRIELVMCEFGDLSELKKCTALEEVTVDNCRTDFDIKWIENTGVKDLHISVGNGGSIKNMDRVTSIKKLEHLLLFFTGISEQSVKKIKKSLPDCKVEVWEFDKNYDLETKIY